MNIKYIILMVISLSFFSGCSPVDKVKFSRIDLLGNEVSVHRIISRMSGSNGEVTWTHQPNIKNQDCDLVSAGIKNNGTLFFLNFSYDRRKDECRLLEYRINGKPESPLYIYKFLFAKKRNYIPEFLEPYIWPI